MQKPAGYKISANKHQEKSGLEMHERRRTFQYMAALLLATCHLHIWALATVPLEIASTHFTAMIDGKITPVMHAAVNDYFLNFDVHRCTRISVTAEQEDFWTKGVAVQPWRLGIRPKRNGQTITFGLASPAKISILRPGDYLGNAEMLYLFANKPETDSPVKGRPGLRYYGPGVHRENINAETGDSIYLAPGAVVFGALNTWGAEHVKVFGRGVIVYDGPQNSADDDGWMHKRNWHCIVMDEARDVSIEGITCVTRSRTWQVQMKNSRGVRFENVKMIGANAGNANADGMDCLGVGDTIVSDSFLRAADDIFGMYGSWEGYGAKAFAVQGNPVTNITIENSVVSTSISNLVRAGWPKKNFEGGHFVMRNSDVLHMGMRGCGVPFALMELWADPNGRGRSADFRFEDVRMEHRYSLMQLLQPAEGIHDVHFTDVVGLELPSLMPSVLKGNVHKVRFDNVNLGGALAKKDADIPIEIRDGVDEPTFVAGGPVPRIVHTEGLLRPGKKIMFEVVPDASAEQNKLRYEWTFGDGSRAFGRQVKHKFPDGAGTLLDGSARFRVLVHMAEANGRTSWGYAPVVVTADLKPALGEETPIPGLRYRYFVMDRPSLSEMARANSAAAYGMTAGFDVAGVRGRGERYGVTFGGMLTVPTDSGSTITLLSNDSGRIAIAGQVIGETPEPFSQVCGLAGNAVRTVTGTVALAKGKHSNEVMETHTTGEDGFRVLWQGPGFTVSEMPATLLSHVAEAR